MKTHDVDLHSSKNMTELSEEVKEFENDDEENAELCVKRKESMAGERSKFVCKQDDLEEDSEDIFDDYYGETIEDNENSANPFEVTEDEFSEDMSDDFVENLALIENNIKPSESDDVNDSLQISIRKII